MNQTYSFASLRNVCIVFLSLVATTAALAQTVWTGSQDANYLTAANWSNGLPAAGNNAVIPGGATVLINGNLNADYDMNSFGEVTLAGTLSISGEWSLSGVTNTMANRMTVFGTMRNFGSIAIQQGGSLFVAPTGTARTSGPIVAEGWVGVEGQLFNADQVDLRAGSSLEVYNKGALENRGALNVFSKLINRDGGTYVAPNGGTINVKNGGVLNNASGAKISNAGRIGIDEGGRFLQEAELINTPGRIFVSGNMTTTAGSVTSSTFLTVEKGGVLNVEGHTSFEVAFSLQNFGVTRINQPVVVEGLVTNGLEGRLTITGLGELDFVLGTNLNNEGAIVNDGRIKTVGTFTNDGTVVNNSQIIQEGNGTIANNKTFVNKALIESVDQIVNNGTFRNEGRLTNKSGGRIENNGVFINTKDAHVQNLFVVLNRENLTNDGYFENGVTLFNQSLFVNNGFLDNVGDITNAVSGTIDNNVSGVIDNSGSGIFTNDGVINDRGELNNFSCGVLVNNNLIRNFQWINNEGLFFNNGTIEGKPVMGGGPVVASNGMSPKICEPITVGLSQEGKVRVSARQLAATRFDSCAALKYLIDGKDFVEFTCADIGTEKEVTLTLRDRKGNEIKCKSSVTVEDKLAPRIDKCPEDVRMLAEPAAPARVSFVAPTFTDNCGPVTVTSNKKPGDLFPEGLTVVTYTATDASGNSFKCAFNVEVRVASPGICQGRRGTVTYERYDNIRGYELSRLTQNDRYPDRPSVTEKLSAISIPNNVGDNYGTRTRGWIYPTKTGEYQLAVAADDHTRLLLSTTPDDATNATLVAAVYGYTGYKELNKYANQTSRKLSLVAGKGYYFELLHKEGGGSDHANVFWKVPGSNGFEIIASANIGDISVCPVRANDCVTERGTLLREVWTGINSNDIWALLKDSRYPNNPTRTDNITRFASDINTGDNYGTRVRGYLHPSVTGDYKFTITGDDQTKLMLSTDDSEAKSVVIADINGWTNPTEFDKYPSQLSKVIRLVAGQRYYVELLHQEGGGGDFFSVYWQTPTNSARSIIPGANLSPYKDCTTAKPTACNKDILFVVGSSSLNNGDAAVKHYLTSLGYNVLVKDPQWATVDMARGKGLVIISSTVNSADIGGRFTQLDVPVLTWEAALYDDLKMTGSSNGNDYGSDLGDAITVDGAAGPLAAGYNGSTKVTTSRTKLGWGKVMGSQAKIVAYKAGDKWRVNVFVYDKGAQMMGGLKAPGIRIGFYFDGAAASLSTPAGAKLFRTVVEYATGCVNETQGLRINPDILHLEAARREQGVELVWTNNTAFKNEYFSVERSSNSGRFEVIGTVEATGEGDAVRSFSYVDAQPAKGDNVYRVTAMYNDHSDYASEQRLVRFVQEGRVNVYPNPAVESFSVSLSEFGDKEVSLVITDQLGRTLARRAASAGQRRVEFDTRDYPSGAYSITIVAGGFLSSEVVIINRD